LGLAVSAAGTPYMPGDVTGDGKVNIEDILMVRDFIFGVKEPDANQMAAMGQLMASGAPDIGVILGIRDIIFGVDGDDPPPPPPPPSDNKTPTTEQQSIIDRLRAEYPEGTPWDNSKSYDWYAVKEYAVFTGRGCAGFAFLVSDALFGTSAAAKKIENFNPSDLKVGDIIRINNNTHSVVVLQVKSDSVIITEGNYIVGGTGTIHWDRELPFSAIGKPGDYIYTRY